MNACVCGGVKFLLEPREQRRVAADRSGVHQCQQEFRIVHFEPRQLVELPDLMADDQTGVPERMQQRPQKSLVAVVQRPSNTIKRSMSECRHRWRVAPYRRARQSRPVAGGGRVDNELSNQRVQAAEYRSSAARPPSPRTISSLELPARRVRAARRGSASAEDVVIGPYLTPRGRPRYFPLKLNEYSMPTPIECC